MRVVGCDTDRLSPGGEDVDDANDGADEGGDGEDEEGAAAATTASGRPNRTRTLETAASIAVAIRADAPRFAAATSLSSCRHAVDSRSATDSQTHTTRVNTSTPKVKHTEETHAGSGCRPTPPTRTSPR